MRQKIFILTWFSTFIYLIGLRIVEKLEIHAIAIALTCFHLSGNFDLSGVIDYDYHIENIEKGQTENKHVVKKSYISSFYVLPHLSNHVEENPNRMASTDGVAKSM